MIERTETNPRWSDSGLSCARFQGEQPAHGSPSRRASLPDGADANSNSLPLCPWSLAPHPLLAPLLILCCFLPASLQAQQPHRIDVSPGGTLTVRLRTGGSLEVEVWDQNVAEVTVHGAESCGDCNLRIEPDSKGVRISSDYPHRRNHSSHLEFDVRLPRRFNIDLDSMGGGLEVYGLDGSIRGRTMGGGLHFEDLHGKLDLTTMGGDVTLRDSEVDGQVTTMGGRVLFERVRGDVRGKSMGGQVIYRNVENPKDSSESVGDEVHIETMGGEIRVEDAPYGARLRTMGGDIEVAKVRQFLEATTYGGDIEVGEVDGDVDLKTYSGDIRLTMVGEVGNVDVSTLSGRIVLQLPANFSGSIEADLSYTRNSRRDYQIRSDFPLELDSDRNWDYSAGFPQQHRTGSGRIGSGTARVHLRAVNGDIEIRRGG